MRNTKGSAVWQCAGAGAKNNLGARSRLLQSFPFPSHGGRSWALALAL